MQFFKSVLALGLAAIALADDCDDNVCSSSSRRGGVVLTDYSTTTVVAKSTGLVPLYTQTVYTSTSVDVNGTPRTLTLTSNVMVTPVATIYSSTTYYNLQSGYAYTTLPNGVVTAAYTGTGSAPALTSQVLVPTSSTRTGAAPIATAMPYMGAAAIAGGLAMLI